MGADSPGFRHGDYAAGRLYYNGFCYSSSVIDTHAHYLGFAPGGVYSQSNNRRSYGFQLRCLQEEGTRWVACWGCLCLISNRAFRARKSEDRTAEKVRPCAHPPRRYAPGRQGRQLCESRPTQPNFSAQDSPAFLRIQPPRRGERPTPPPAEGRNVRAAHFRPPLATAEKLQFESNCTHRAFYWPDGREKRAETTPAKHPTGTSGPPAKHPTGASGTPGKTPNGGQRRAIQDKQRTGFRQAAWPSGRHPAPLRTDSGRVPPVGSAPDTSSKGSGIGMPPE